MFHALFRDHIFQQNAPTSIKRFNNLHIQSWGGDTHLGYGILRVQISGIWDIGTPVTGCVTPPPPQSCINMIVPLVVLLHTSAIYIYNDI